MLSATLIVRNKYIYPFKKECQLLGATCEFACAAQFVNS